MKKILITGSRGALGTVLTDFLKDNNLQVYGFDLTKKQQQSDIVGDLTTDDLSKKIPSDIDSIIHLAAFNGVSFCEKDPIKCYQVNFIGTLRLLEFIKEHRNISLLLAGSADSLHYSLNNKINNFYSHSKSIIEGLSEKYSRDFKLNIHILQMTSLYGFKKKLVNDKVIPSFINKANKNEEILINDNLNYYNFTHYIDVLNFINEIFKGDLVGHKKYLLANNDFFKLNILAKKIIKSVDSLSDINIIKNSPIDHTYIYKELKRRIETNDCICTPTTIDAGLMLMKDTFLKD